MLQAKYQEIHRIKQRLKGNVTAPDNVTNTDSVETAIVWQETDVEGFCRAENRIHFLDFFCV